MEVEDLKERDGDGETGRDRDVMQCFKLLT